MWGPIASTTCREPSCGRPHRARRVSHRPNDRVPAPPGELGAQHISTTISEVIGAFDANCQEADFACPGSLPSISSETSTPRPIRVPVLAERPFPKHCSPTAPALGRPPTDLRTPLPELMPSPQRRFDATRKRRRGTDNSRAPPAQKAMAPGSCSTSAPSDGGSAGCWSSSCAVRASGCQGRGCSHGRDLSHRGHFLRWSRRLRTPTSGVRPGPASSRPQTQASSRKMPRVALNPYLVRHMPAKSLAGVPPSGAGVKCNRSLLTDASMLPLPPVAHVQALERALPRRRAPQPRHDGCGANSMTCCPEGVSQLMASHQNNQSRACTPPGEFEKVASAVISRFTARLAPERSGGNSASS